MHLGRGGVLAQRADLAPRHVLHRPGAFDGQHRFALLLRQEETFTVEQLEGVPGLRVVARGDDDAARGAVRRDHDLGRRCGRDPQIDDVVSGRKQARSHSMTHHRTRHPRVTPDDDRAGRSPGAERGSDAARDLGVQTGAHDAADAGDAGHQNVAWGLHPRLSSALASTTWEGRPNGAGARNRTADLRITSALLYQLSYTSSEIRAAGSRVDPEKETWCEGAESNCRHTDFQSVALPTELPSHLGRGV